MTRDLEYNITAQDNGVTISDYLKKQGFSHAVIVPVSYTHLDVYKRQVLSRKCSYFPLQYSVLQESL